MINHRQTPKGLFNKGKLSDLRNEVTASQVKVIKPNGEVTYQEPTYWNKK